MRSWLKSERQDGQGIQCVKGQRKQSAAMMMMIPAPLSHRCRCPRMKPHVWQVVSADLTGKRKSHMSSRSRSSSSKSKRVSINIMRLSPESADWAGKWKSGKAEKCQRLSGRPWPNGAFLWASGKTHYISACRSPFLVHIFIFSNWKRRPFNVCFSFSCCYSFNRKHAYLYNAKRTVWAECATVRQTLWCVKRSIWRRRAKPVNSARN